LLASAALTAVPASAHAGEIAWRAPPECQRVDVAIEQVEKLVGRRLESVDAVTFEVEVEVAIDAEAEATHRVLLRTLAKGRAPRERVISGASCASVTDAVSVAIALTIDEEEPRALATEPIADGGTEATVDASSETPAEPRRQASPALFVIGLGPVLDAGVLPDQAVGLDLSAALELGALRLGASFAGFMPQETQLSDATGGARFDFVRGNLELCGHPRFGDFHLLACAGFELGRIGARGTGVRNWRDVEAGWYAPRVLLGVGYGFAKIVRVFLRGGIAMPLTRREFLLDDEHVHQPDTTSLRASLSVELVL
jgi:hypothetical protein